MSVAPTRTSLPQSPSPQRRDASPVRPTSPPPLGSLTNQVDENDFAATHTIPPDGKENIAPNT